MFGHYKYAINQNGQKLREIEAAIPPEEAKAEPVVEPTEDAKALEEHLREQDWLDPDLQGNH